MSGGGIGASASGKATGVRMHTKAVKSANGPVGNVLPIDINLTPIYQNPMFPSCQLVISISWPQFSFPRPMVVKFDRN